MKKRIFYLLAVVVVLLNGCQKEKSFEAGKNPSHGSLQSDGTGDCLPKTVNGIYLVNKQLAPDTNTITVAVDVTTTGSYIVSSDTVNGYYFKAVGVFAVLGVNTVTLKGNGTPVAAGTNNFVISYDSSSCDIAVNVLPAGAGGPAAYTLTSTSGSCTFTINGTYGLNTALTSSNTVAISVDVTTIGTYSISTTATGGMTFSASGIFLTTGVQTVTLTGTGTPTTQGNNTIPVTAGTSTCSFVIDVLGPALGTMGGAPGACTIATVAGVYSAGNALVASNTVTVRVFVTTKGAYTISTNTVDGFSFSSTGTFATTGMQTVVLNGNGTPLTAGPKNFTVTFGTSSCTFSITVGTGSQYTVACSSIAVNGDYTAGKVLDANNTIDLNVNVTTAGPYSISIAGDGMTFSGSGNFPSPGPYSISLTGSGTPVSAGNINFNLATCTFQVVVDPVPTIDWKFSVTGGASYEGSTDNADLSTPVAPFTVLTYTGSSSNDLIIFGLADISSGILNNETYNTNSTASNAASFGFTGTGVTYSADATTAGVNITFTVISHNTTTKIITGTFSGTVRDASNAIKTITGGQFTVRY